jgi:hypothetical protein
VTLDEAPTRGGHVLVGCVEGEWHMLAARMAAEVLRVRGWSVTFLGPSVPAVDLGTYVTATAPDAVALSCSLTVLLPGAERCIRACREEGLPVLAGGAGFAPDGRYAGALGADGWAPDPVAASRQLDSWLDAPQPAGTPGHRTDSEDRALQAARTELVGEALGRLLARAPGTVDVGTVAAGVDLVLGAVESATLVDDPELLSASTSLIERAMPEGDRSAFAFGPILEGLLPALRLRSARAADLVERALPAVRQAG